jgi:hypothetical protein
MAVLFSILILPKIFKPLGGQFCVSCRVLNVAMPEPLLNGSRIVPIMRQLKATSVAQHVRVHGEGKLDATDQLSLAAREARRLR